MKLNGRHRLGLALARRLPPRWSWKLLKIPTAQVLAREAADAIAPAKDDLSALIPRRPPLHDEIIGSEVFAFDGGYSTHWGANLTRGGRLVADLSRQGIGSQRDHFAFGKPRMKCSRRIRGTVAALTIEHRSNYFHFISDSIARLQLIENLQTPPDYLYVQANQKYQAAILARMGYAPERIIDSSQHPFIQADRLLVPSYVANFSTIFPASAAYLKSRLVTETPALPAHRVIYINRKDSPRRKVLNEEELLRQLAPFDVKSITLSELSLDEQIAVFAQADVIVMPTGAGLANLTFARPGLFLIVLTPPNWFGESALAVIEPFGVKFLQVVLSDYPAEVDPYNHPVTLTGREIRVIVEAVAAHLSGSTSAPLTTAGNSRA